MRILVTGAEGFVGKNLVESLKNIRDGKDRTRPGLVIDGIDCYDVNTEKEKLAEYCREADFVFHLAGVNRPKNQEEFMKGNFGFSSELLDTLKQYHNRCPVMLASSIQATLEGRFANSEYGRSKAAGEELFFQYAKETQAKVLVYRFPNLFGKWCRPNYNSVVATFCHNRANDLPIQVNDPNTELELLYIDDLVNGLLDALEGKEVYCVYDGVTPQPQPEQRLDEKEPEQSGTAPRTEQRLDEKEPEQSGAAPQPEQRLDEKEAEQSGTAPRTEQCPVEEMLEQDLVEQSLVPPVKKKNDNFRKFAYIPTTHTATLGQIADTIETFRAQPETLVIPEIPSGSLEKKLYSTYLSYLPKEKVAFSLKKNEDERGSFTELLKTVSGGQFSVNVSKPGITKGEHWHHSKWEFFIVVSGSALIRQRRVGSDPATGKEYEIMEFYVDGEHPQAVHMLPGYTHSIVNLSDTRDLITLMWANESFDQERPDTYREAVGDGR